MSALSLSPLGRFLRLLCWIDRRVTYASTRAQENNRTTIHRGSYGAWWPTGAGLSILRCLSDRNRRPRRTLLLRAVHFRYARRLNLRVYWCAGFPEVLLRWAITCPTALWACSHVRDADYTAK